VLELGVWEMELRLKLREVHIPSLQILEVFRVVLPLHGHLEEILLQRLQRLHRFKKLFQRQRVWQNFLQILLHPKKSPLVLQEYWARERFFWGSLRFILYFIM